jgi:protein-S-isoprenylcysteine O-methyltransferase Ste14
VNDLAGQTLAGFVFLIAAMGLALFGPAWTLVFWQAWVYLAVFVGSAALITLYLWRNDPKLLARRVHGGPGAENDQRQNVIQTLASIAFLGFLIVSSLDHRFSWSAVPLPIVIGGDVLVALGFLIVFIVFRENPFSAATIDVTADQTVVATGLYAIVRHPMYAGALVMLVGMPLALGSWWGLLVIVPMMLVLAWRLLDEERFLSTQLPGYAEYCRRVRYRLVPLVW